MRVRCVVLFVSLWASACGPRGANPETAPPPEPSAGVDVANPEAAPGDVRCNVEIIARDGTRTDYEVAAGGELTIGRESFTDITIPNSSLSRRHARVISEGGACVIEDMDSTNGVYINDVETPMINDRREVGPDDEIFIGPVKLHITPR